MNRSNKILEEMYPDKLHGIDWIPSLSIEQTLQNRDGELRLPFQTFVEGRLDWFDGRAESLFGPTAASLWY